jgi:hypothetical protein
MADSGKKAANDRADRRQAERDKRIKTGKPVAMFGTLKPPKPKGGK